MTFDEALALLEISPQTPQDEAKRAYLRLVKRHGPERDPQGFRRVREAYELVRHRLPLELGNERPVEAAPGVLHMHAPSPEAASPAENAPVVTDDTPTDAAEPVAGPREVEAAAPPEPQPQIVEMPKPPLWLEVFARAAEAKTLDQWEAVAQAFELALAHPGLPLQLPASVAVRMLLKLMAAGRREEAARLEQIFSRWLAENQNEIRLLSGEMAAEWVVFRQSWRDNPPADAEAELERANARFFRTTEQRTGSDGPGGPLLLSDGVDPRAGGGPAANPAERQKRVPFSGWGGGVGRFGITLSAAWIAILALFISLSQARDCSCSQEPMPPDSPPSISLSPQHLAKLATKLDAILSDRDCLATVRDLCSLEGSTRELRALEGTLNRRRASR